MKTRGLRLLRELGVGWGLAACLTALVAAEPGIRIRPLEPAGTGKAGFTRMDASATGLVFTNFIPESRHLTNQLLLDGGGVTAGDVDGDGRADVFLAGLGGGSALWRNLGGLRFTNVTATAFGPEPVLGGMDATGCAMADLDGNGAPDLVVNSHGQGTAVLLNDGRGGFRALPQRLNPGRGGHSVAIADVDGDGWLDLYVVNYRVRALMDMPNARATFKVVNGRTEVATVDGRPVTEPDLANRFIVNARGGVEELGEPDVLYLGRGGTNFVEVPWTGGAWLDPAGRPLGEPCRDWGLAAQFRDLDGDGRPELYVCNDFQSPDRLWRNESTPGRPRFREAAPGTLGHSSRFSMGVDFADVNRDEHDDLVVLDMLSRDPVQRLTQLEDAAPPGAEQADPMAVPQYDVNTLQLGRGDGTFAEVAAFAGVQASEWSWTPAFVDVDLDGWEDLLITTGQWRAARDLDVAAELRRLRQTRRMSDAELFAARRRYPRLEPPMVAFRNEQGRFREVAAEWGLDFRAVGHGLCLADLDGDGDPDVVVNHLNSAASILRNDASGPRLQVRVGGGNGNRLGIGARITVRDLSGTVPVQSQEIVAGGRYLSGDAAERTFAVAGKGPWSLEVRDPAGRSTVVTNAEAGKRYEIGLSDAEKAAARPARRVAEPLFEELSSRLGHVSRSEAFDEFIRQPLLPRRISTEGPGIACADLDADGVDELILPGGYRGQLEAFRIRPGLVFERWTNLASPKAQAMAVPWGGRLLLAESTYTEGTPNGSVLAFFPGSGPGLAAGANAVGTLAAADVDGDGVTEVFVGARVVPGRWPQEPVSALVSPGTNGFAIRQVLTNAGLVTAAVFADLDLDGDADLAVSSEWSEPRLFRNDGGRLGPWSRPFRFDGKELAPGALAGMWTAVDAGDFDGDGVPDLMMGNWGENTYWELFGREWAAFHADMDGDGSEDVFTAYARPGYAGVGRPGLDDLLPMHGLEVLGALVPSLREQFKLYRDFASAPMSRVLGAEARRFRRVDARWAASVVLLNRPTHWEVLRLPDAAQWSPVMGLAIADWDGDGREDAFLSQNFFGQHHGLPREDAGRGLVLRGLGDGRFEALSPEQSGIRIEGEGRAAVAADFDADGRPDLAVATHNGPTRVFRNRLGRPGLRVRLEGGEGNRTGAGARVRLKAGAAAGPARLWRAGSGRGSCSPSTQVMARPGVDEVRLEVDWPGGVTHVVPVAAGISEVRVRMGDKPEVESR